MNVRFLSPMLMAALVAVGASGTAAAQGMPSNGMNGPMGHPPSSAQRAKMMQMHAQARAAVLGALTTAHKALLASVVGALATAANPDPHAAAAKLDAALTPAEKHAILAAAQTMHAHMQAMMPSPAPGHPMHPAHTMPTDPGQLLLMMSAMTLMANDAMMGWH